MYPKSFYTHATLKKPLPAKSPTPVEPDDHQTAPHLRQLGGHANWAASRKASISYGGDASHEILVGVSPARFGIGPFALNGQVHPEMEFWHNVPQQLPRQSGVPA